MADSQADAIKQLYQQYLGRPATDQEVNYLDQFAQAGHIQPFQLGQIIQGLPEYQNKALGQYGQQYSDQLGQSDNRLLNLAKQSITQDFAQNGRSNFDPGNASYGSSGFYGAFANAAQNLATQRQSALSSFYGGGYNNILGAQQGQGNNQLGIGQQRIQGDLDYSRSIADYYRQANDYNGYLNQQHRLNNQSAALGIGGALLGAGIGGSYGGIGGARLGAGIGSLFGKF